MPQQAPPRWIATLDTFKAALQFAFLVLISFTFFIFCSIVTILVFAKFLAWVFS